MKTFKQIREAKQVWDKPNPVAQRGDSEKLSPANKARARARAKAAGRPYPNMVDNIWAARKEETEIDEGYIPIVVPKMIKEPTTKKPMPDIGMHPAKQRAIADKKAGKAYKNPYPFDKNKSAPENADHNMYKATFHHYKEETEIDEAGPFSYGTKPPRKGSIADLAAKRRKEQEKNKAPIEPRDQMVGTAKLKVDEAPAWTRKEGKSPSGGLNAKGIASYRRANPGSKLSMAVTTPPSKLDPDSKAAKRRKSFCARMGGMEGPMKKPNGEPTRKALALRKWNC